MKTSRNENTLKTSRNVRTPITLKTSRNTSNTMNTEQFNKFMSGFTTLVEGIAKQGQKTSETDASSTAAPRISIKLPTYKGEPKENILVWLLQIQNIFETQGVTTDKAKMHYAATALEDGALHWYLNKVKIAKGQMPHKTWNDFIAAIQTAFEPPNYQQHLRRELKRCKQTSTVQEYSLRFRNIVGQINDMGELDQVTYFVEGLRPATQAEVNYRAPATLEEAWKLAIAYDNAHFGAGKMTKDGPRGRQNVPYRERSTYVNSTPHEDKTDPMELDTAEKAPRRFGKDTRKTTPKGACYNCRQTDHYARNCKGKNKAKDVVTNIEETNPKDVSKAELKRMEDNRERLLRFNGKVNGIPA